MAMKPTICLNMIVKNESHIIIKTLENLCNYFQFSYWVISDTGSTDNTKELITDFFKNKQIDGEIVEHEWLDFGYNRTKALECAYNKTDLLFIFDADDEIVGEFVLPDVYDCDLYKCKFGVDFVYYRPLLINNRKKWGFKGVLHEYLVNIDETRGGKNIEGNYHLVSGRSGNRSKNPNKYRDDANILKKAHFDELGKDYGLSCRYAFYCAQSYKDAGSEYIDDAIEWYKKCLTLNMWDQEKYHSCLTIGELYMRQNDKENALKYWYKTIEYDSERIEGIINAANYLRNNGQNLLVNALYYKFKNYNPDLQNKLFLFKSMYNNELEYNNTISAYYVNDKLSGYECSKIIFINKILSYNLLKLTISNFKFYIDFINKDTDEGALQLFYAFDEVLHMVSLKNESIDENMVTIWTKLFEKVRASLSKFYYYSFENKEKPKIFISFTTCKRLDLFKQTIYSMLNHWLDINKVDYWFCVDDNSSNEDRLEMKSRFPWIEYYMKTQEEKGHRQSMNIIWNKLNELKPNYWIHMEDDFLFYNKMNYIGEAINALNELNESNVKQILFNKNYGETIQNYNTRSHDNIDDKINNKFVLHNYSIGNFSYPNCHYWPHYSFRPSLIDAKVILELGNYDSLNQFFEMDYAKKWTNAGFKSAFFNKITNRHIGRLTSDRNTKVVKNAYDLNNEDQFNNNKDKDKDKESRSKAFIKIVNLERRKDRKDNMTNLLKNLNIDNEEYEFIKAVDGNSLEPTQELYNLFKGNDFGSRKGVIGCALSHYQLWKQLLNDKDHSFYLIMEDDFTLCKNFKQQFEILQTNNEFLKRDVLFLGYHMFEKNRQTHFQVYNIESNTVNIESLNRKLYIGGTFSYSVNKKGAKILIDYIENNGIKHGIDYVMKIMPLLNSYECQPQMTFSEWNESGKNIDSDIQNIYDGLDFTNIVSIKNEYDPKQNNIYINGISGLGNNLFQIATAIYYKETYKNMNFNIILNKSSEVLNYGTANKFGRKKLKTSYFNNILNRFQTTTGVIKTDELYNDCLSLNKLDLKISENSENSENYINLLISGYNQNVDLFFEIRDKLLDYFNLDDDNIKKALLEKYKFDNSAVNIMLGIRIGIDGGFRYSKFTKQSYAKTINSIIETNTNKIINIYVLSDVDDFSFMIDKLDKYNIIYVNEDDISQIYIGLMCSHFILSDSTYHWWIAFLKWTQDNSSSVYVYNNTDITNRCLINSTLKMHWNFVDIIPDDSFVFIKGMDHHNDDIFFEKKSVPFLIERAKKDKKCVAFNTLGFFKNKVNLSNLKSSQYYDTNDGLYIKKEYYEQCITKKTNDNTIKIKMLCNWTSSEQVCKEWSYMCETDFKWKNYQLVWTNIKEDIDYYVIINSCSKDDYFDPKRTIVFQMEPWVNDTNKPWGVKTWGKWAEPNPNDFLAVRGRKTECHNNAFWQLGLTLNELQNSQILEKTKGSAISSICSSKYFDEGHIARVDFLKFLEAKGDIKLDIYNQDNKLGFKNYIGPVNLYTDKHNGIKSYKYYFMMENNFEKNFITEKLWEPILCETLVFYYGCPNVSDYIDPRAFVLLDITDFEKSYQIIKQAVSEDWWSQRIDIIRQEKQKILNELAFFPTIDKIINNK